jgi:hypothetical protein
MKFYLKHPLINKNHLTLDDLVVEKDGYVPKIPSDKVAQRMSDFGMMNLPDVPPYEEMEEVPEEHTYHSSASDVEIEMTKSPKSMMIK